MKDRYEKGHETEAEEQQIADLLRLAGRRPDIDPAISARVYERVLRTWEETRPEPAAGRVYGSVLKTWRRRTAWSRHRRWLVPAGLAASAALAFFIILQPAPPPSAAVGTVSKLVAGTDDALPGIGATVHAGDTIDTGPGVRLSLALLGGESLRIDENTHLTLTARDEIALESGRIYADTGEFVYRSGGLTIETELGSVADIGTQFAVAFRGDTLDVAVREGRVDVSQAADEHIAIAGERLLLDAGGDARRQTVAPNAAFWNWAAALAPSFDIENRSLLDFLKWVSRESGMEIVFASEELRMSAMRTDLHGSVAGFEPLEALDSVIVTTNFSYRLDDHRIVIGN